jgi:hypothetical protein
MKMSPAACLRQELSIRKWKYRVYTTPLPVTLCKAVGLLPRGSFKSKRTYKCGVIFSPPSNELQDVFRGNT